MKAPSTVSFAAMLASAAVALSCGASQAPLTLLVGTYTEGTGSHGVYLYSFDPFSGRSELLDTAACGNPSYLILADCADSRSGISARSNDVCEKTVKAFCVNEFSDGRQGVSSFDILLDGAPSVTLTSSAPIPAGGEDPCNILYTGDAIVTANYTGGSISSFEVLPDGTVGPQTRQWAPDAGARQPASSRGSDPHLHCAVLSPDGRYIFAADLGSDCVHRFERLSGDSPLGAHTIAWQNADSLRYGPRHMVFSPDGRYVYLLCELSDKLVVFSYLDGKLSPVQTLLAYGGEGSGSADLHFSPDGRRLYTSHRLKEDGISTFRVDPATGLVTPEGYRRTGVHPRNFAITPDGRWLLCACRDSGTVELYSIDQASGALIPTGRGIRLPAPVCVQVL